jgi:hypothetical protein
MSVEEPTAPRRRGQIGTVSAAALAACFLLAPGTLASEIRVCASGSTEDGCVGATSNAGNYHAQLEVTKLCEEDFVTVPDGPIGDSSWGACEELTANAVEVTGQAYFRAGSLIRLGDGFSVQSGASLVAETGAEGLGGNAYLRDETPNGEKEYHVRFYLNPDDLTLSSTEGSFDHLVAYNALGSPQLLVGIAFNQTLGERRLFLAGYDDDGTEHSTQGLCELPLGFGWQFLEATWTSDGGSGGDATIRLQGGTPVSVRTCLGLPTGLANAAGQIDAVEWGAPGEITLGEHGVLLLDDFDSRRVGPIGPL